MTMNDQHIVACYENWS